MGVVATVTPSLPQPYSTSGEEGQTSINTQSLVVLVESRCETQAETMMKCLLLFVLSCFLLPDVEAYYGYGGYPTYPPYPQPAKPQPAPRPHYQPSPYQYQNYMLPLIIAQQQAAKTAQADQMALMMALGGMGGGAGGIMPFLMMQSLGGAAGGAGGGLNNNNLMLALMGQGMGGFNNPMWSYYMLNQHKHGAYSPADHSHPAPAAPVVPATPVQPANAG